MSLLKLEQLAHLAVVENCRYKIPSSEKFVAENLTGLVPNVLLKKIVQDVRIKSACYIFFKSSARKIVWKVVCQHFMKMEKDSENKHSHSCVKYTYAGKNDNMCTLCRHGKIIGNYDAIGYYRRYKVAPKKLFDIIIDLLTDNQMLVAKKSLIGMSKYAMMRKAQNAVHTWLQANTRVYQCRKLVKYDRDYCYHNLSKILLK